MSRTYRRKNSVRGGMWLDLEYYTSAYALDIYNMDSNDFSFTERYKRIPFEKGSLEYRKGAAKFHSDAGTTSFKEPGPHWFRNLFTDRPARRAAKRELQKFMQNSDYEPMILPKDKLEYWT